MEWGEFQINPSIAKTHPPPHVPSFMASVFTTLSDLSSSRINTEYGYNMIPYDAKINYAIAIGVEDVASFFDIITEADAEYVFQVNKKLKRARDGGHSRNQNSG